MAEKSAQQRTEKTDLEKERVKINARVKEIEEIKANQSLSSEVKNTKVDGSRQGNWKSNKKIRVSNAPEINPESEAGTNIVNNDDAVDVEVGNFMKEFAQAKQIPDERERMTREKELVDGLSDVAKENLMLDDEVGELLEPGYFKPLSAAEETIKQADVSGELTAPIPKV